jgi:hypothetical protein
MSAPARRIERTPPPRHRAPQRARSTAAPTRRSTPAKPTPAKPTPAKRLAPARGLARPRRVKRHHLGFAVLASVIVGAMLFAIVVLHVLLAQQAFRIDAAQERIATLSADHLDLLRTQATLSAPDRIASWATRHGMRLPDSIRILRAPKTASDPVGAGNTQAFDEDAVVAAAAEAITAAPVSDGVSGDVPHP